MKTDSPVDPQHRQLTLKHLNQTRRRCAGYQHQDSEPKRKISTQKLETIGSPETLKYSELRGFLEQFPRFGLKGDVDSTARQTLCPFDRLYCHPTDFSVQQH